MDNYVACFDDMLETDTQQRRVTFLIEFLYAFVQLCVPWIRLCTAEGK